MTKIKIDKNLFEMSEDASLVLQAHIDRLKIYKDKNKITEKEFIESKKNIEIALMSLLERKSDIEKSDIDEIIETTKFKKVINSSKDKGIFFNLMQLILNLFKIILSLFVILFKLIIVGVKIIILVLLGSSIIGLLFGIPLVFFPWVIDNQIIFSFVPDITKYSLLALEIAVVLFFVITMASLFNSKNSKNGLIAVATVFLVIGLNGIIYGGYNIYYNYGHPFEKIEKFKFNIDTKKDINLQSFDNLDLRLNEFNNIGFKNPVYIEDNNLTESSGSVLEIDIITTIMGKNKEESDKYFTKLNNVNFSLEGNNLILITSKDSQFKEVVPYKFLRRTIIIKKPKDVQISRLDKRNFKK